MKISAIGVLLGNAIKVVRSLNDSSKGHSKPGTGGMRAGSPPPPQPPKK
jgi:hypothetical protein